MSAWPIAIEFVLRHETARLTRTPGDRGGLTKYGISQRSFPTEDIEHLTEARARDIYYEHFWLPVRGQEIPAPLALAMFDFAVLSSPQTATKYLQHVLGVEPALGNFREITMAAVRAATDPIDVARRLTMLRADHYGDICEADPTQLGFLGGWTSRLVDLAATFARL